MKSLKLYIIVSSVFIVIYLAAQFNRPRAIDWSASYSSNDKIPFGAYIVYHRLTDIFPGAKVETFREPIYNVLADLGITHGAYLIICKSAGINEYDFKKLVKFIKADNDVFICATQFGDELFKKLKIETADEFRGLNSYPGVLFTNKYLDTNKIYSIAKNGGQAYFSRFDTAAAVVLGKNTHNHVNFLKYHFGKGHLFINTDPLLFTNFSLLSKSGGEYAATALSFVKNDSRVIWDQYYALGRDDEGSSMRVFLRSGTLRWAFYVAFFSLTTFVLYEIKRRQRIIPVVEPLENSTLGFVNIVGQVYYEQHDNCNISHKKILYFLEHLRVDYNLKTNQLDEEFIDNFSQKTGIDRDFAKELINYIILLTARRVVNNHELVKLNKLTEQFYIKAR